MKRLLRLKSPREKLHGVPGIETQPLINKNAQYQRSFQNRMSVPVMSGHAASLDHLIGLRNECRRGEATNPMLPASVEGRASVPHGIRPLVEDHIGRPIILNRS